MPLRLTPLLQKRLTRRAQEMIESSLAYFPELDGKTITVGYTRKHLGSATVVYRKGIISQLVVRLKVRKLSYQTIGHELTHLVQGLARGDPSTRSPAMAGDHSLGIPPENRGVVLSERGSTSSPPRGRSRGSESKGGGSGALGLPGGLHRRTPSSVRGDNIPSGEKQCDIWTLARHKIFCDDAPTYIRLPRALRERWPAYSDAVRELCRAAIEKRKTHRLYIRWLEGEIRDLAKAPHREKTDPEQLALPFRD